MTDRAVKILLVDDETGILETLQILFKGEGYDVRVARSGKEALERLEEERPDILLSDIRMPGTTGLEVLARAREVDPEIAVILMTAQASLQSAVRAVNEGAYYYLQKPFANDELLAICSRAAEARLLKKENRTLKREIRRQERRSSGRPVGKSRSFTEILELAETVAPTDSTVLLSGESGTGKEVIARYVHTLSDRAEGSFHSLNCGALPESLLESELFGHVKGSFTGAVRDKDGLLVAARGGTFFLDEIGEMSPALQVKLLRVLQEREVVPVGSTESVPVDVRIIAATNRDLEEEIRRGTFRSDLYYRLNVIALHLPPLRERRDDIPLLADHFLERLAGHRPDVGEAEGTKGKGKGEKDENGGGEAAGEGEEPGEAEAAGAPGKLELSEEAQEALMRYDWPGNVRELENALERAAVVCRGGTVEAEHLPERILDPPTERLVSDDPPDNPPMEVIERAYIAWVLEAEGGNKTRAAEVLGIDPSTLYRKLKTYGIGS